MGITKDEMIELSELVAQSVVKALIDNGLVGANNNTKNSGKGAVKSAYAKTEQLLFNYKKFHRIVEDKKLEIEELRQYGVPGKSSMSGGERVQSSRTNVGLMTSDESVESAIANIEKKIASIVDVIALIDDSLSKIENDSYYPIISMRYFEGRTLEDIGVHFNVEHSTISRNKNRLVKELSLWLFPDDVITECMC